MSLPEKFEICTKTNRTSRYQLTLGEGTGNYHLQNVTSLEDAYNEPKQYSARFVQEAIDCGNWIMTKNLDEAVECEMVVSEDRPLVFPFTVLHKDTNEDKMFVVTAGWCAGSVTCTYKNDSRSYENCFTEEYAKHLIKNGIWIVKHVGEEAPEQKLEYAPNEKYADKGDRVTRVEAPQSASSNVSTLAIKVDTDAAVEAVERLTQALEDLAISYESVIALQREFKEGV